MMSYNNISLYNQRREEEGLHLFVVVTLTDLFPFPFPISALGLKTILFMYKSVVIDYCVRRRRPRLRLLFASIVAEVMVTWIGNHKKSILNH